MGKLEAPKADDSLSSPGMKAYHRHTHQPTYLRSSLGASHEGEQSKASATEVLVGFSACFNVSLSVDLNQHAKAFLPIEIILDSEDKTPLSLSLMQDEDRRLEEEVVAMLRRKSSKGLELEKQLCELALKLIAAEYRRKVDGSSLSSSDVAMPSKQLLFGSRFTIDGLIRQLLSVSHFPKVGL